MYQTLTVATGDAEEAKELFADLMAEKNISAGQVVNFSEVHKDDPEFKQNKKQFKLIYNDGIIEGQTPGNNTAVEDMIDRLNTSLRKVDDFLAKQNKLAAAKKPAAKPAAKKPVS